jgi:hypothetical protein
MRASRGCVDGVEMRVSRGCVDGVGNSGSDGVDSLGGDANV